MTQKINGKKMVTLSLTSLASGAIWFYTGPLASIMARGTFNVGYDLLYGIPHWYNPSYTLTYAPLREHVGHYAYQYGGFVLGSVCAPLIYKGINFASNLGGKVIRLFQSTSEEEIKTVQPLQFTNGIKASLKTEEKTNNIEEHSKKTGLSLKPN